VSVGRNHHLVPQMGSIVTCRVLSISSNVVRLNIHCIGEEVLKQPFKGLLRKHDIRDFDKEKVQISQNYIGLGENHSFLVTTADNELGVVVALNQSGIPMKPISWTDMSCQTTFATEPRKVAQLWNGQQIESSQKH